jgi:hypothetical protein|tara:strand:+ start:7 stop:126 length:120 start_codon:yes stop_codon:yes gene_type:complete
MNTLKHHLARLEMMMMEERGIIISYEEALELTNNEKTKK